MNDEMELEPGVDLDSVDFENADRGDNLEADEPKVEVEAEPEKETEPEERERDDKGRFMPKIPKARFDEAVGKERDAREAAEKRAAELEAELAQRDADKKVLEDEEAFEAKIDELQAKHADLLLEGETTEANKLMREIRKLERDRISREVEARSMMNFRSSLEAERLDSVIKEIEKAHPELDPNNKDIYDDYMVKVILGDYNQMVSQGASRPQAMQEATERAYAYFNRTSAPDKGLAKKEDRRAAQIEKNLDTKRRQPPNMRDTGLDSDKLGAAQNIDVTKLSQEEFNALPEATIKKLRGDVL